MTLRVGEKTLEQARTDNNVGSAGGTGRLAASTEQEAMFRTTMEAAQVGIFVLQDQRFKYVNPYLTKLLGYSEEEMLEHMGPLDVIVQEQHAYVVEQMRLRVAGVAGHSYELQIIRKDGSVFPAMVVGSPSVFGGRVASVGTLTDISMQKAAELRIRELADYDVLTGLPNRRLLRERFEQLLAAAERENESMIRWVTVSATSCCARWRGGWTASCGVSIPWRGWAAMSSFLPCLASTRLRRQK